MLSERPMSEYKGAALMLTALPPVIELFGDRGCGADWFRKTLKGRGIAACIPGQAESHNADRLRPQPLSPRHKIEKPGQSTQRLAAHPHPL